MRQAKIESKKPAFFQKDTFEKPHRELSWREKEHEAYKKFKEASKMDFDPEKKSYEELKEFFKISGDTSAVNDMTQKMLESTTGRLKTRSNEFLAFLNKQFNIMNFKSARCSMHCFDSTAQPLANVGLCLQTCREGITGCRDFANNLQKESAQKLSQCIKDASD